jgi:hypothetical protein
MSHGRRILAATLGALIVAAGPALARAQTVEGPTDLVLNLERVALALRSEEMPAILRQDGLTVHGITALLPGTLSVEARSGSTVLLRGSRDFDATGSGHLVLRPTPAGRETMRRSRSVPVLLVGSSLSAGLLSTATHQAVLVRDWLTAGEARRAVAAAVRRRQGTRPGWLAVEVVGRCGSGCLAVRAAWLNAGHLWTTAGRARQVDGELRAALQPSLLH